MEQTGSRSRDDAAELLGGFAGEGEPARGQALAGGRILLLERLHGRVEHLAERGEVLDGPVVELLGDPPPLGPLGEQALGEERSLGRRSIDHRLAERDGDRLGAGIGLELREDVAHVALHGLLADEELLRDVGVRHPVGEQLEDLPLAWVRIACPSRPVANTGSAPGRRTSRPRRPSRSLEQRVVRRLLEDVAPRARLEPTLEERPFAVRGEDEDAGVGHPRDDLLGRLDAVHLAASAGP